MLERHFVSVKECLMIPCSRCLRNAKGKSREDRHVLFCRELGIENRAFEASTLEIRVYIREFKIQPFPSHAMVA